MTDIDALEVARRHYRALDMSAAIMRDPKRTGGWEGAERTARAFERQAETAKGLFDFLTTERAKVAALEAEVAKLAHIRLIERDTSSSHSEKLGAIFRISRAGTSDHYSASDMHDNPERETVGDVSEAKEWEDYDRDC